MPTNLRLYYAANRALLAILDLQEELGDGRSFVVEAAIKEISRIIAAYRPPTPPDSPCPCGCDTATS